jgi:anti-sigma B factor antagonist
MDVLLTEPSDTGVAVLSLDGQLDIDSAPRLRTALDDLQSRSVHRIVVDLTRLRFCDSIGLSALLVAARYCAEHGGFLRLANPSAFLQRICSVVGIAEALPMYRSVEDASVGDPAGLIGLDRAGRSTMSTPRRRT